MISTGDIESLVPDFLMESGHFYLVITDVEGRILKFNHNYERISAKPLQKEFWKYLSVDSAEEFCYSLELMLGAPKITRHLLLEHPIHSDNSFSQVWWEFSVITTPDMDISAIIGIGVGIQFLEQEMPWNNLVDVLGFGKISLNSEFKIQEWDSKIQSWFSPKKSEWLQAELTSTLAFSGFQKMNYLVDNLSNESKPKCFLIQTNEGKFSTYASLLVSCGEGFQLFLVPKEQNMTINSPAKVISQEILETFPNAVFVLDTQGKLVQQNELGKVVGRNWKGRAYSEGQSLSFPSQSNRFSRLVKAIEEAKMGMTGKLELKMLNPTKDFSYWNVTVNPTYSESGLFEGIWIHVKDISFHKKQLAQLHKENETLREFALYPSHILRGPLSTMMGLLELIDRKQLDQENHKLFEYLKPLTKEMDQLIRQHAKKMSAFD